MRSNYNILILIISIVLAKNKQVKASWPHAAVKHILVQDYNAKMCYCGVTSVLKMYDGNHFMQLHSKPKNLNEAVTVLFMYVYLCAFLLFSRPFSATECEVPDLSLRVRLQHQWEGCCICIYECRK